MHASWQQTPSVQKPLPQSRAAVHFAPSPLEVPALGASVMVTETAFAAKRDGAGLAGAVDLACASSASNSKLNVAVVAVLALGMYWNVSWPVAIWGTTLNCLACSSAPVTMSDPTVTIPSFALESALASTVMLTPKSVGTVGEDLAAAEGRQRGDGQRACDHVQSVRGELHQRTSPA